jgi:SAM-dependent methyltransferase
MASEHALFDRGLLIRRRDRTAGGLEAHDFLLARAAEDIVARLGAVKRDFPLAVDLGAQHGLLARMLGAAPNVGRVVSAERSLPLLARCPSPKLACDEELLPFADGSLDLVVSGLALQHVNDLPGALVQIRRALKPDGLFLAAVLGGNTLAELREAFVMAEAELEGGASPRVAPFADVRDYGALLQRAGFALPVTDADLVRVTYAGPFDLMRELRALAWTNVLADRSRRPLRRATLMRAAELYADRFADEKGRIVASFEIIMLTGWAPHESPQKPLKPGSAAARLADALGVEERSGGVRAGPAKPENGRG